MEVTELVDTQDIPTLQESGIHLVSSSSLSPPASPSITDALRSSFLSNFHFHPFPSIPTVTVIVHVYMYSQLCFLSPWPVLPNVRMMLQACKSDFLKPFLSFSLSREENWISLLWHTDHPGCDVILSSVLFLLAVFSRSSSTDVLVGPHPLQGAPCLLFSSCCSLCPFLPSPCLSLPPQSGKLLLSFKLLCRHHF